MKIQSYQSSAVLEILAVVQPHSMTNAALRGLHKRVLAGDANARSALFDALFDPVSRSLRRSFPGTPRDWVSDAVVGALLQLSRTPVEDIDRIQTVEQFLLIGARRSIEDILRADRQAHRDERVRT